MVWAKRPPRNPHWHARAILPAILAAAALAGCGTSSVFPPRPLLPLASALPVERVWTRVNRLDDAPGQILLPLSHVQGRLYWTDSGNILHAVDSHSGRNVWHYRSDLPLISGVGGDDFRETVERNLEPPRIGHLRHQADVGHGHMRATCVRGRRDHRLDRGKTLQDPVVIPGVDLGLLVLELALEILQRDEVVERMDVAGDHLRDGANLGALQRIGRQQRGLGMDIVEIFDNGERLRQRLATGQFKRRHPPLRIDGAKLRRVLVSAVLGQMDGHHLVGQALEIERDAHAVSGG